MYDLPNTESARGVGATIALFVVIARDVESLTIVKQLCLNNLAIGVMGTKPRDNSVGVVWCLAGSKLKRQDGGDKKKLGFCLRYNKCGKRRKSPQPPPFWLSATCAPRN
jgi:hypothetical protein